MRTRPPGSMPFAALAALAALLTLGAPEGGAATLAPAQAGPGTGVAGWEGLLPSTPRPTLVPTRVPTRATTGSEKDAPSQAPLPPSAHTPTHSRPSAASSTDTLSTSPWLELRLGGARGEVRDSPSGGERSTGGSAGLRGGWPLVPFLHLTGGLTWSAFGCEGGLCVDAPVRFSGMGVEVGLEGRWQWAWAEVGLTRRGLEARWTPSDPLFPGGGGGEETFRSSAPARMGVIGALGARWEIRPGASLTPGLRIVRHSASFEGGPSSPVTQLHLDVGLRWELRE